MKKKWLVVLGGCWVMMITTSPVGAIPSKEIVEKVKACVYEVVIPKQEGGSISYEKALPFDLLPYAIRNDDYYSIGSAFSIGQGEFVTAAHVVNLMSDIPRQQLFIRDQEKQVYEINEIKAFSSDRDFVIFTVRGLANPLGLQLSPDLDESMNSRVYAVGNALGEGTIIRDGLLTSRTPEELDGKWHWLRFSAAASPGNSGGPLLNEAGHVLGVILKKSPNENLNYALPIDEAVGFSRDYGIYHEKYKIQIPLTVLGDFHIYHRKIKLPAAYQSFRKKSHQLFMDYYRTQMDKTIKKYRKDLFPYGPGSDLVMHTKPVSTLPHLIYEYNDKWYAQKAQNNITVNAGPNGKITFGNFTDFFMISIDKPDDLSIKALCQDSQAFMDYLLKGVNLERSIENEDIRVTSLGKAVEKSIYHDRYQRPWVVRIYRTDFNYGQVITFSLAIPKGMVTFYHAAYTGVDAAIIIADLKYVTDYALVTMEGTLKEWSDFLAIKKFVPAGLQGMVLNVDEQSVRFTTNDMSMTYTKDILPVTEDNFLQIGYQIVQADNRLQWQQVEVQIKETQDSGQYLLVKKEFNPPDSLDLEWHRYWEKIIKQKHPFDGTLIYQGGMSVAYQLHHTYAAQATNALDALPAVHFIGFGLEGTQEKAVVENKLNKINQSISLN